MIRHDLFYRMLFHVRSVSQAEVIRAKPEDIPMIFQVSKKHNKNILLMFLPSLFVYYFFRFFFLALKLKACFRIPFQVVINSQASVDCSSTLLIQI